MLRDAIRVLDYNHGSYVILTLYTIDLWLTSHMDVIQGDAIVKSLLLLICKMAQAVPLIVSAPLHSQCLNMACIYTG
jgi:hypothetical protein